MRSPTSPRSANRVGAMGFTRFFWRGYFAARRTAGPGGPGGGNGHLLQLLCRAGAPDGARRVGRRVAFGGTAGPRGHGSVRVTPVRTGRRRPRRGRGRPAGGRRSAGIGPGRPPAVRRESGAARGRTSPWPCCGMPRPSCASSGGDWPMWPPLVPKVSEAGSQRAACRGRCGPGGVHQAQPDYSDEEWQSCVENCRHVDFSLPPAISPTQAGRSSNGSRIAPIPLALSGQAALDDTEVERLFAALTTTDPAGDRRWRHRPVATPDVPAPRRTRRRVRAPLTQSLITLRFHSTQPTPRRPSAVSTSTQARGN